MPATVSNDSLQNTLEKVTTYLMSKCHDDKKQSENLFRALFFMQKETADAIKNVTINPVTKYVANLIDTGKDNIFEMYIEKVIEDTKTAESDPEYKKFMNDLYSAINSLDGLKEENAVLSPDALAVLPAGILKGTAVAFARMDPEVLSNTLVVLEELSATFLLQGIAGPLKGMGDLVKAHGKKVVVALVAIELCWEAFKNISKWWKGEISGKFCAKGIIDACAGVGGGLGGCVGGAELGGWLGPFGALVGGIVGAVGGQFLATSLAEKITCKIFDVPKTAALDNAYRYLGISHGAPNEDVNHAYRQKALTSHPDKGGTAEEFHELQLHMGIIKVSRGAVCK